MDTTGIITRAAAAAILSLSTASAARVELGAEDFSLYAEGDSVAAMRVKAETAGLVSGGMPLFGLWSATDGDASAINPAGALALDTCGAEVSDTPTPMTADALRRALDGEGDSNGEIFVESTMLLVPSDTLCDALPEGPDPDGAIDNGTLKYSFYPYERLEERDGQATYVPCIVVYHSFFMADGTLAYTNDVIETEADFSLPVTVAVTMRKTPSAGLYFTLSIDGAALSSATGCTDAELAAERPSPSSAGTWFRTVNGGNGGAEVQGVVTFAGQGEVASLGIGYVSAAPDIPEWAAEADADDYAAWAMAHGNGADLNAPGADFSPQYLMNVDATVDVSTIYLSIESITVSEDGSHIAIKGMAGGNEIPLGRGSEPLINGVLNVKVGNAPGEKSLVSRAIDAKFLSYAADGAALVTVPASAGNFVKATVDYTAAAKSLSEQQ